MGTIDLLQELKRELHRRETAELNAGTEARVSWKAGTGDENHVVFHGGKLTALVEISGVVRELVARIPEGS